jgi:hypothetical protein
LEDLYRPLARACRADGYTYGMHEERANPQQARRAAFALAAVLAATALTGGAAITGLTRHATAPPAATIAQPAQIAQAPVTPLWEGDD